MARSAFITTRALCCGALTVKFGIQRMIFWARVLVSTQMSMVCAFVSPRAPYTSQFPFIDDPSQVDLQ